MAMSCTPTERVLEIDYMADVEPVDWSGMGPGQIRYELAWSTEGIEAVGESEAWSATTDTGVWVRVDRGYLVTYSIELVECEDPEGPDVVWNWASLLEIQAAHAGHGTSLPNPVAIADPYVESLTDIRPSVFGTTAAEGATYCETFYLVAKGLRETRHLPDDAVMVGRSLFIDGAFRAPGAQEEVGFVVESSGADGLLSRLVAGGMVGAGAPMTHYQSAREAAVVRVERRLSTLFDGLDWTRVGDEDFSRGVLRNLIDNAQISVATRDVLALGAI